MPSLDKRLSSTRREVEERRRARPLAQLEREVAALAPIRPFTESIGGEEISFVQRVKEADGALLELAEELEVAGFGRGAGAARRHGRRQLAADASDRHDRGRVPAVRVPAGRRGRRAAGGGRVRGRPRAAGGPVQRRRLGRPGRDRRGAHEDELEEALELLDPDSFLLRNRGSDDDGSVDFERTFSLLEEVPAGKTVFSQGGVRERDQVAALERSGVDAVILGPWAAAGDLAETLRQLRGESR
jgi:Indole-3-glycerol phosphate synthase